MLSRARPTHYRVAVESPQVQGRHLHAREIPERDDREKDLGVSLLAAHRGRRRVSTPRPAPGTVHRHNDRHLAAHPGARGRPRRSLTRVARSTARHRGNRRAAQRVRRAPIPTAPIKAWSRSSTRCTCRWYADAAECRSRRVESATSALRSAGMTMAHLPARVTTAQVLPPTPRADVMNVLSGLPPQERLDAVAQIQARVIHTVIHDRLAIGGGSGPVRSADRRRRSAPGGLEFSPAIVGVGG